MLTLLCTKKAFHTRYRLAGHDFLTQMLFERKMESLSAQLRRIITEAEKHNLTHELIHSKRGEHRNDYRTFMQRRILIKNKRCAIFTAKFLSEDSHP